MSSGISPKLPLTIDSVFGPYNLITDYVSLARQNFKMLLLTNPGERMMNPDFGVGVKRYLFELNDPSTYETINDRILEQTKRYLKYIQVNRIDFSVPENSPDLFPNDISIAIEFTILPLQTSTMLEIQFDN